MHDKQNHADKFNLILRETETKRQNRHLQPKRTVEINIAKIPLPPRAESELKKNEVTKKEYQRGTCKQFNKQRLNICLVASSLFIAMNASTYCFQYLAYTRKW